MPEAPKPKRRRRPFLIFLLVVGAASTAGVLALAVIPPPLTILMVQRMIAGDGMDYRWRALEDISPNMVYAAMGAEDNLFCIHSGFDKVAIRKAWRENRAGLPIRGGSSISQQTAKNVFLWPNRNWLRKGLEAGYTVAIEKIWSKRRIMEVYLNIAETGPGVFGVEAGAQYWFHKSARDLTQREAALLAAVLPSPRQYKAAPPGPYVRAQADHIQDSVRAIKRKNLAACVID